MTRAIRLGLIVGGTVLVGATAWAVHPRYDVQVESLEVTAGPIVRRVLATGSVQAVDTVEVGAQVSGIIQTLDVDFNSRVRAGQAIASLDPSLYQAALEQARAVLGGAEAASIQAHADLAGLRTTEADALLTLSRARVLAAGQLISNADLNAAEIAMHEASADVGSGEARVDQANAGIAAARAALDQATVNLNRTVIRSPIDGIVIDRQVAIGQTLAATVQAPVLYRIATDLTHVRIQVDIDESDVGGLAAGEPATFQVESYPGETFHGTVTQVRLQPVAEQTTTVTTVATSITPATTTAVATVVGYAAVIDVANPDERLRPGMTAEVSLNSSRRDHAVRIPNGALSFRPPPEVLQALKETEPTPSDDSRAADTSGTRSREVWEYDGRRFTPIAVHVGLADGGWTELLSGSIRPGDVLVTSAALERRSRI